MSKREMLPAEVDSLGAAAGAALVEAFNVSGGIHRESCAKPRPRVVSYVGVWLVAY